MKNIIKEILKLIYKLSAITYPYAIFLKIANIPDEITGHFPHWVLCDEKNPSDKYHIQAFNKQKPLEDGTYELIGVHFQNNPYNLKEDVLEKHGIRILRNVPRDYKGIKDYLENNYIEGIVFYRGNGEMCKIKRSDFGFEWNIKRGD